MAGASTPELAAAVSNAGALGSISCGYLTPDRVHEAISATERCTSRPFAVNLFVTRDVEASPAAIARAHEALRPFRERLDIPHGSAPQYVPIALGSQIDAILERRPAVFSFTFGIPDAAVIEACKSRGIFTIGTATTVDEAVAIERAGIDAVCVQGFEAGGHRGSFLAPVEESLVGTLSLVPQVADAVRIPVLAAGGIGDGRGVAAVLALGAAAAQVGSAFLAADESAIPAAFRDVLGTEAGRRTALTAAFSGRPARGIRNRFIDEMQSASEIAPYPIQNAMTRDIRTAAATQGRAEYLSLWAGQSAFTAKRQPAARIVADLMEQARISARRALEAGG